MFLHSILKELNNYFILPDFWGLSDHASLLVYIIIEEEFIQEKKLAIIKNNEQERKFMNSLKSRVENINTTNIYSYENWEETVEKFTSIVEELWYKHARQVHITKYSKTEWNNECSRNLFLYQISRRRLDWIKYKDTVKIAKYTFFNNKIQEIVMTNKRL